jgi:hypothetical protein
MLLEHPSLEPFEPIIASLLDCAFGDALRGLSAAGLQPGDEWHTHAAPIFKAACLPGFRNAQKEIADKAVDLENRLTLLNKEETNERSKRNHVAADLHKALRIILQHRQLVLRRIVDGMLWVLFWPNKWVLRRLRLEGNIRRLDPNAIEQMLKAVAHAHEKGEEEAWIICDLSTIAQIGDLIRAKWEPAHNSMKLVVVELKVGPKNVMLSKRLHGSPGSDLNAEIANISKDLGPKAAKQAARMVRQERRLKNFVHVLATDEGVHPVSGQKFRMTKKAHVSKDYRDEIRELVSRAKLGGSAGVTLDKCLHLLAIGNLTDPKKEGFKIAHEFFHMRTGDFCRLRGPEKPRQEETAEIESGPMAISLVDFDMATSIAMPPLLWYPRETMLDVLFGRIYVFAQLDYEKFFALAARSGLKMRFVRGKEAARIKSANLSGPLPEYRDLRYIQAETAKGEKMYFGARFFAKVYMELVRPLDLFEMASDLVEEAAKAKRDGHD